MGQHSRRISAETKASIDDDFVDKIEESLKWMNEVGAVNTAIQERGMKINDTQLILDSLMVSLYPCIRLQVVFTYGLTFP